VGFFFNENLHFYNKFYHLLTLKSILKGIVHPKINCHNLFTLKSFQTCVNFFVLLNTKEDILNKEILASLEQRDLFSYKLKFCHHLLTLKLIILLHSAYINSS